MARDGGRVGAAPLQLGEEDVRVEVVQLLRAVQVFDGGERELGDDGVVHEGAPPVLQLLQREVARELDAPVHSHEVVRLGKKRGYIYNFASREV